MTTPFWLYNPNILLKPNEISQIWPAVGMTMEEKLNAITRLVLLLTLIGYIATQKNKIILSGVLTLGAIVLLYLVKNRVQGKKIREGFTANDVYDTMKINYTEPTVSNPSMNVLLPEINDNPTRNQAAPAFIPAVEADMNKKTKQFVANNFNDPTIDERLFNDLGDSFSFDQSMRAWYPMPNTTVPNDQQSFADYCYGDMIACRDDTNNEMACTRNMPPRWTNY
jgi:hypothetical protein